MNRLAIRFLSIALLVTNGQVQAGPLNEEQLSNLPESTRDVILLNREVVENGGQGIKAISFKDADYRFAITSIYDGRDEDPPIHMALVSPSDNGASIAFKINRNCSVMTRNEDLISKVIRVDDQNVSVFFGCGSDPSSPNGTQEVYTFKTSTGLRYVLDRLKEHPYVFVDFGSGRVPFATDGFDTAWQRADSPVL